MVDSASIIKIEEFDTVLMTLAFDFFFKTNGQIDRFIERFSLFFIFAKYLWSFLDMTLTAIYIIVETKEFRKKRCISVLKSCDCNDVEQ